MEKMVLLEIQGFGRAGDPFGYHEGKRIFVEGAPKEAKWVIAEITSLRERFGSATCIGAFQSLEKAKSKLAGLRERPKTPEKVEMAKPERVIKKPIERRMENVVFVGRKPAMSYVVACITLLHSGIEEVTVKARGRAIVKAVDAVELLRRTFMEGLEIKSIQIGTEEVTRPEGKRNLSTIEITVRRRS